ncbi:hypothetical protein ACWEV3_17830 [Saccharopolyspora sp. NPDC003752]
MADETTVTFDSGAYRQLNVFVDGKDVEVREKFLKASSGIRLDPELGNRVKVGNPSWIAVQNFNNSLKELGASGEQMNRNFAKDWHTFSKALVKAQRVFEETDDLASYEASKFNAEFPEFGTGGGGTGGTGAPPPTA